jgi:hypothetical protein
MGSATLPHSLVGAVPFHFLDRPAFVFMRNTDGCFELVGRILAWLWFGLLHFSSLAFWRPSHVLKDIDSLHVLTGIDRWSTWRDLRHFDSLHSDGHRPLVSLA